MSQPSVAAFFHSRKRAAVDDIFVAKTKIAANVDSLKIDQLASVNAGAKVANKIFDSSSSVSSDVQSADVANQQHAESSTASKSDVAPSTTVQTRSGRRTPVPVAPTAASSRPKRCLKRSTSDARAIAPGQQKIVKFTLAGHLSPKKLIRETQSTPSTVACNLFSLKESNVERGLKTPTKEEQQERLNAEKVAEVRSKLSMDDIKERIARSGRRPEMLASLGKISALEESRQRILSRKPHLNVDKHSLSEQQSDRAAKILGKSLKTFDTIDLEVLSSPQKGMTTPTKQIPISTSPAGGVNELMSPKKTITPKRLFSPAKASPPKVPLHQAFAHLAEKSRPSLQMPYKYRCLAETFKCVDTVCAMFFNRHETITMKKLKPAVQRMLRKNFCETYLAQINHLFPDAYRFHQKKMLNAGSHTKYDYYQLVIVPNVRTNTTGNQSIKLNEDDIIRSGQQQTMNPQVMIERQQTFNRLLLDVVKEEHDKFLRSLDPPMVIPKEKITHWHAEFDLNSCPEIPLSELPQPPNVEKFSSAKDILSTARNLFNCATPSERIMKRFEAKLEERAKKTVGGTIGGDNAETDPESEPTTPTGVPIVRPENPVSAVLKGVPKTLLERIRAKQAAKALDAMTRRPSQDKEAGKYERLPELARHLRNIFVTESKSVLELDTVLTKIENSFRERISKDCMKELLQIIGKEVPNEWLTFHHIRKTDFVKIKKDVPLNDVIQVLERKAADKAS